jgi:hypothetical protein
MRKTLLLLTTMTLALLLAAGVALAQDGPAQQTTIHFDPSEFSFVFPDPCNPQEEVTITGTAAGFITEVVTPTGEIIRTIHLRQMGTGVGSEGTEYSLKLISNQRLTVAETDPEGDPSLFTSSGPVLINNLGGGPNLLALGVVHVRYVNDEPVVEFFLEKVECRG